MKSSGAGGAVGGSYDRGVRRCRTARRRIGCHCRALAEWQQAGPAGGSMGKMSFMLRKFDLSRRAAIFFIYRFIRAIIDMNPLDRGILYRSIYRSYSFLPPPPPPPHPPPPSPTENSYARKKGQKRAIVLCILHKEIRSQIDYLLPFRGSAISARAGQVMLTYTQCIKYCLI